MSGLRFWITALLVLWLAAVLQIAVATRISLGGFRPDFLLICLVVLSLFGGRLEGAVLGFLAGVLQGALPLSRVGHYIVSRSLTGFFVAWSKKWEYEVGALTAALIAFAGTCLAQLIWMFLAAPPAIGAFLGDTILSAVYNGVLAAPVYALLKRILTSNSPMGP